MLNDFKFSFRQLLKNPGFTVVAVLTLALGIGGTTAIYTVVDNVLLNPLPGPEPKRLIQIAERDYTRGGFSEQNRKPFFVGVTPPVLEAVTGNLQLFEQVAWADSLDLERNTEDFIARESGCLVSASFFRLWSVPPLLGRTFAKEEAVPLDEQSKPARGTAIVLSYPWWQSALGGDPNIIGRVIELSGRHFTVIGVMPRHFRFPWGGAKFWIPGELFRLPPDWMMGPDIRLFARLKSDATIGQTEALLGTIAQRLKDDHAFDKTYKRQWSRRPGGLGFWVRPARLQFTDGREDLQRTLFGLLAAIGFVLLIVCANVANLTLARIERRQQELAIRAALGAGRVGLMRQLLGESVLVGCVGGIAGLAVAMLSVKLLAALIPEYITRLKPIHLDGPALGFSFVVSIATGLAVGCVPAWHAGRTRIDETLKQAGLKATAGLGRKRYRSALVVLEFALALVLLTGAGLMIESVIRMLHVNPGFDPENLVRIEIQLPWGIYNDPGHYERATQLRKLVYGRLYERLAALPGVKAVGIGKHSDWPEKLTLQGGNEPMELVMEGCGVGLSDLFRAMRIPLRAGRYFEPRDVGVGIGATIINETMARTFWPGEDPLGKKFGGRTSYGERQYEVIGVVADIRDSRYDQQVRPTFYRPCHELRLEGTAPFLVVRTSADPQPLLPAMRKELHAVEPSMRTPGIYLSQQHLYESTQAQRSYMLFLVVFALVGLLLASLGIYGVLAYSVTRRLREIGIRVAVGAERRHIFALVFKEGGRLVAIGVGSGLVAAFCLTRLIQHQLFGVSPTDPWVFTGVVLLLIAVAFLACLLPARRATRIHPMEALRYE